MTVKTKSFEITVDQSQLFDMIKKLDQTGKEITAMRFLCALLATRLSSEEDVFLKSCGITVRYR
jgi:hypothetical protein